jgi:predicted enzyme related to lactoylglutathione lyase
MDQSSTQELISGVDFAAGPVRDLETAAELYGQTLGLRRSVYIPDRNYAEFETGNLTLSAFNAEEFGLEHHQSQRDRLQVDDVEEAGGTLEQRGVSFNGDTLDTGVCHMAFFSDPEGNAFMLHHRYAPRHAAS